MRPPSSLPPGQLDWLEAALAEEPLPAWEGWPPNFGSALEAGTVRLHRSEAALVSDGGAYVDLKGADGGGSSRPSGPLNGFTFAVKNVISVAGVPSRLGSATRDNAPPELEDAPAVAALRAAGAEYVGATALHEFAFGVTGVSAGRGSAVNPWDRSRIAGGSSSGSAVAVAEGSARVALGTDTGGSVRIPAALCGVVGFKPARDSYSQDGTFPLSPTLDHLGVFTRSVGDLILAHSVLADEAVESVNGPPAFVYSNQHLKFIDRDLVSNFDWVWNRLSQAGASVTARELPDLEQAYAISTAILLPEAAATHRDELSSTERDLLGADVRARLEVGEAFPPMLYDRALAARKETIARMGERLDGSVLAIGPTVGEVAPRLDSLDDPTLGARMVAHTRLATSL